MCLPCVCQEMIRNNSLPLVYKPELPARIGLVPKAGGEVRWFEMPSYMGFHVANAWEENGQVKVGGWVERMT